MLILLPVLFYFLVWMMRLLFSTGYYSHNSPQALRSENLSQALIDGLLASWVTDSIHKFNKSLHPEPTLNSLQTQEPLNKNYLKDTHYSNENKTYLHAKNSSSSRKSNSTTDTYNATVLSLSQHMAGTQRRRADPHSTVGRSHPTKPPTDSHTLATKVPTPPHTQPTTEGIRSMESEDNLFMMPPVRITPDWGVVLGTFDHYDDDNWENFLIESDVPLFVRRLLGWFSETLYIKKDVIKEPGLEPQDFQLLITTANLLITHQSRFHLRDLYHEADIDGTDSQNMFYFLTPRTLVQNKLKERWHMYLFRQFDEHGCNMTVVDRKRKLAARRYYKRIPDDY